jgi:hypothetical protein
MTMGLPRDWNAIWEGAECAAGDELTFGTDEIGDWRDVLQELGKTPPTITGDLEGHRW